VSGHLHFLFLGLRWTCTYSGYIHLLERGAFLEWWLCELHYPGNVKFGLRHSGFVLKWNILCFWESVQSILDLFFLTWYQWVRTNLGADSSKDLSYTFWEIRETRHKTKMIIKSSSLWFWWVVSCSMWAAFFLLVIYSQIFLNEKS
jgi:hypothetical protein